MHIMWLIVMYDLPNITNKEKGNAKKFQKNLIKNGFKMFQYSVYVRYCFGEKSILSFKNRIKNSFFFINGNFCFIELTDNQFESMYVFNKGFKNNYIKKPDVVSFF